MGRTLAMFTDVSLCIGCRACQVACKQWNQLDAEEPEWTGTYQNHAHFTGSTFRLVRFLEEAVDDPTGMRWHMMSDVCKHCTQAGCLEACPTGAIYRTEFGTVNIDQDTCNGCRYCISACPFGVVTFNDDTGTATKCTFCNDRLHNGLGPACAKACPTESITFGYRDELEEKAKARIETLHAAGVSDAQLYGADQNGPLGGLNAFFLLIGAPSKYGLPEQPVLPQRNVFVDSLLSIGSAIAVGLGAVFAFRTRATEVSGGGNPGTPPDNVAGR
jgi:formate dehydrogenase iron-sulfur subunit